MTKKKRTTSTNTAESDSNGDMDFETALTEVEEIVQELESGDTDLTQSLAKYEVGIKRLKQCHDLLQKAERRITLLSGFDADGNPVTEPFETDDTPPTEAKRKSRSGERAKSGAKQGVKKSRSRPAREATSSEGNDSEATFDGDDSSVDDSPGLF